VTEIFVYAVGVMYTPGPVNLLGLNAGLNGQIRASIGFFVGVGLAMLILLLLFGFVGAEVVGGGNLLYVSAVGCLYIAYLAVKIAYSTVNFDADRQAAAELRFTNGLFMQLVNPKGTIATLPIATIQFPAAGIDGAALVFWSAVLAAMAVGAPGGYALVGELLGKRIYKPAVFRVFNLVMASLLLYVAASIAYDFVYLPLVG
jgi:threonine/homoserine/homoserine lactone efflux protein